MHHCAAFTVKSKHRSETGVFFFFFNSKVSTCLLASKTNARSPLLSRALARNDTGSCPSAEIEKTKIGVTLSFHNRRRSFSCEVVQSRSQHGGLHRDGVHLRSTSVPISDAFWSCSPFRRLPPSAQSWWLLTPPSGRRSGESEFDQSKTMICAGVEECLLWFCVAQEHTNAHELLGRKAESLRGLCVWPM